MTINSLSPIRRGVGSSYFVVSWPRQDGPAVPALAQFLQAVGPEPQAVRTGGVPVHFALEIVRDHSGRCYEKFGDVIRPIEASRPAPQILEGDWEDTLEPAPPPPLIREQTFKRLLRFGDWKATLFEQIAHPEKLRESHKLPCDVRIFELTASATQKEVEQHAGSGVQELGPEAARRLGLSSIPVRLAVPAKAGRRANNRSQPGDRFFTITLAQDPTLAPPPAETPPALKTQVPASLARPWEFLHSREEALAEMALAPRKTATWKRRLIGFLERDEREANFAAWQAQVSGTAALKAGNPISAAVSMDDQLWAIRPPKDAFENPAVRQWVARVLAMAGYDTGVMILEWEIFWRRKGL